MPCSLTLPRWGTMLNGELFLRQTPELITAGKGSGLWRSPCATDGDHGGPNSRDSKGGLHLPAQVMWATPVKCEDRAECYTPETSYRVGRFGSPRGAMNLNDEVARWPTPVASDHKSEPPMLPTPTAMDYEAGATDLIRHQSLAAEINRQKPEAVAGSGTLSPDWTEILMGWPKGWTDVDHPCEGIIPEWGAGWEDGTPRVASNIKNRVARLKSIGNGQVPQAAALAWTIIRREY